MSSRFLILSDLSVSDFSLSGRSLFFGTTRFKILVSDFVRLFLLGGFFLSLAAYSICFGSIKLSSSLSTIFCVA